MKSTGSLTACPNPIVISEHSAGPFPVGITRLSWSCEGADAVEVHVDGPDGPLLSRTGPTGSATTGPWVHDGMTFYLQNVSNGLPLTAGNTLAAVTVSIRMTGGAAGAKTWQSAFLYLRNSDLSFGVAEGAAGTGKVPEPESPSIVVLSGITANNLGDDAMLVSLVRDIQRLRPDATVTVLAENPDLCGPVLEQIDVPIERSVQLFVQGLLHILRTGERPSVAVRKIARQLLALRAAIVSGRRVHGIPEDFLPGLRRLMAADAVVDCGGASLSPHWKSYFYEKCLDYLLAPPPLFISGQGIDPLEEPDDVELLVQALSQATQITLREQISERYLMQIGCRSSFRTTGDDALTLQPSSPDRACHLLETAGLQNSTPHLALQYKHYDLFGVNEEGFLTLFARYVDKAIASTGLPILGVPMHFGVADERKVLRRLGEHVEAGRIHVLESHITPGDAKALFGGAQLAFGISYHSAIFSLSSATPFLGLYAGAHYAQKMLGLSELYDLPQLPVAIESTTPAEFGRILKGVLENREEISRRLRQKHQELVAEVIASRERFLQQIPAAGTQDTVSRP